MKLYVMTRLVFDVQTSKCILVPGVDIYIYITLYNIREMLPFHFVWLPGGLVPARTSWWGFCRSAKGHTANICKHDILRMQSVEWVENHMQSERSCFGTWRKPSRAQVQPPQTWMTCGYQSMFFAWKMATLSRPRSFLCRGLSSFGLWMLWFDLHEKEHGRTTYIVPLW